MLPVYSRAGGFFNEVLEVNGESLPLKKALEVGGGEVERGRGRGCFCGIEGAGIFGGCHVRGVAAGVAGGWFSCACGARGFRGVLGGCVGGGEAGVEDVGVDVGGRSSGDGCRVAARVGLVGVVVRWGGHRRHRLGLAGVAGGAVGCAARRGKDERGFGFVDGVAAVLGRGIMRGVFLLVRDAAVVDEALRGGEIAAMAGGAFEAVQLLANRE